jgi:hypothetical protein
MLVTFSKLSIQRKLAGLALRELEILRASTFVKLMLYGGFIEDFSLITKDGSINFTAFPPGRLQIYKKIFISETHNEFCQAYQWEIEKRTDWMALDMKADTNQSSGVLDNKRRPEHAVRSANIQTSKADNQRTTVSDNPEQPGPVPSACNSGLDHVTVTETPDSTTPSQNRSSLKEANMESTKTSLEQLEDIDETVPIVDLTPSEVWMPSESIQPDSALSFADYPFEPISVAQTSCQVEENEPTWANTEVRTIHRMRREVRARLSANFFPICFSSARGWDRFIRARTAPGAIRALGPLRHTVDKNL